MLQYGRRIVASASCECVYIAPIRIFSSTICAGVRGEMASEGERLGASEMDVYALFHIIIE